MGRFLRSGEITLERSPFLDQEPEPLPATFSFDKIDGMMLGTAIGGSTHLALHIPAIAYEADRGEITMDVLEELSRTTLYVAKMNPATACNLPDFHAAGGVPAVMNEILPLLHADALTVTGRTVAENVAGARATDSRIIRSRTDPWNTQGGLAVLRGNLAPRTAITKSAAIDPCQHVFSGVARCFDSEVRRMLAEQSRRLLKKYRAGSAADPTCPLRQALSSAGSSPS